MPQPLVDAIRFNSNTTGYDKSPAWVKETSFTDSHQTFFCDLGVSGIAIGHACPRSLGIIRWMDLNLFMEVTVNYLTNHKTHWWVQGRSWSRHSGSHVDPWLRSWRAKRDRMTQKRNFKQYRIQPLSPNSLVKRPEQPHSGGPLYYRLLTVRQTSLGVKALGRTRVCVGVRVV